MAASLQVESQPLDDILSDQGLKKEDLDEECSQAIRFKISLKITDWKMTGYYLEMSSQTLRDIEVENRTEDERRIVLLETWHKREGRRATCYRLLQALYRCQRRDLVEEMCDLIKSHTAAFTRPSEQQPQQGAPDWLQ